MTTISLVSVVFDVEVPLLELQARSIRMHVDPRSIERIIVIDNCLFGLGRRRQRRLLKEYGPFASRVTFVRTRTLFDPGATTGWRSQQAAKLVVSSLITSEDYVTLDAKNHFIRATDRSLFVGEDGRAHGAPHPYLDHPLRASLAETLRYVGADEQQVGDFTRSFPPTATPFVLRTSVVKQMIATIEQESGQSFAAEFESKGLLEFFLYSAWVSLRGPGLGALRDDAPLISPTVWPKASNIGGVETTIEEAARTGAHVFAVHRQALARADEEALDEIARYWAAVALFDTTEKAKSYIRRFRRGYTPALVMTRLAERVQHVLRRVARAR